MYVITLKAILTNGEKDVKITLLQKNDSAIFLSKAISTFVAIKTC